MTTIRQAVAEGFQLRRKRTPLKVYFTLRSGQTAGDQQRQLYIRLFVDGQKASDYASGVYVRPSEWNLTAQRAQGRSQHIVVVNDSLNQIRSDLARIYADVLRKHQIGRGPRPTVRLVKEEHNRPGSSNPLLLEFYQTYGRYVQRLESTDEAKSKKTIDRIHTTLKHLTRFLAEAEGQHPKLTVGEVLPATGKAFYHFLQTMTKPKTGKPVMHKQTAQKYLTELRQCLD